MSWHRMSLAEPPDPSTVGRKQRPSDSMIEGNRTGWGCQAICLAATRLAERRSRPALSLCVAAKRGRQYSWANAEYIRGIPKTILPEANMLALFLDPLVLCLAVWIVARSNGEYEFVHMFYISFAVTLAAVFLQVMVGGALGWAGLAVVLVLLIFSLMKYCYLTLSQACIVTGVYIVYRVPLAMFWEAIFRR